MRDGNRSLCYKAEHLAFVGSVMGETPGSDRIEEIARKTLDWLGFRSTAVIVRPAERSVCQPVQNTIRFSTEASLSHVAHEIAHLMDYVAGIVHEGHGPTWRGWFVALVESMHGKDYSQGLADSFTAVGLSWTEPNMPRRFHPLFPDEAVEVGGWVRSNRLTHPIPPARVWS